MSEMPSDIHTTVARHGAEIVGIKGQINGLEDEMKTGFATLFNKLDNFNASQPKTIQILTVIGGAVAIVLTATQIVLALTVGPIRKSVDGNAARLDKRSELLLQIMKTSAETRQMTVNVESNLMDHKIHVKELHEVMEGNAEEWRHEYIKEFRELRARMDVAEAANAACQQDRKGIRSWMEKIDNTGTRNQINR